MRPKNVSKMWIKGKPQAKPKIYTMRLNASCAMTAWDSCAVDKGTVRVESVYSVARAMSGTPLSDSYHLGSTIVNDYGRPFANGFNNYSGASGYASAGRFVLYVRGEFQGAPSAAGYSPALAQELAAPTSITTL